MKTLIIKSTDDEKIEELLNEIKDIDGLEIELIESSEVESNSGSIFELAGIWKDKNIDNSKFRDKAWREKK